jgi:hypothetical protein
MTIMAAAWQLGLATMGVTTFLFGSHAVIGIISWIPVDGRLVTLAVCNPLSIRSWS